MRIELLFAYIIAITKIRDNTPVKSQTVVTTGMTVLSGSSPFLKDKKAVIVETKTIITENRILKKIEITMTSKNAIFLILKIIQKRYEKTPSEINDMKLKIDIKAIFFSSSLYLPSLGSIVPICKAEFILDEKILPKFPEIAATAGSKTKK